MREPYSGLGSERTLFKFGENLTQIQVQREPNSVPGSESIQYLGLGSESTLSVGSGSERE